MKKVGLALMRIQPLHLGHCHILNRMAQECETSILGLGSTNKFDQWNPLDFETRKAMVQAVYGDRLKIVQFADIGTTNGTNDWVDYVLNKIKKLDLPDPTDYFTGSQADAIWYSGRFYLEGVSPWNEANPYSSEVQPGNQEFYLDGYLKKLHIVDRERNPVPPATDLRTFIELGSDEWKQWVPRVNHQLIIDKYPEEFKIGGKND